MGMGLMAGGGGCEEGKGRTVEAPKAPWPDFISKPTKINQMARGSLWWTKNPALVGEGQHFEEGAVR